MRTHPGSVHFLPDHSGGISVSRVLMVFFYILLSFFSFTTVVFIFYLLVTFLVKLVFVKTDKSCDV